MGWKGRDVVFWHSHYKCLLGLVDDPMLCSSFDSQTSVCSLHSPWYMNHWPAPALNLSSELSRNCLCFLCSLAPATLLSKRSMLPQCSEWQLRSCLKSPRLGWRNRTAALCINNSKPCYLTVLISLKIWPFPPMQDILSCIFTHISLKALKTWKVLRKIYFHKLKTHTKETVKF